MEALKSWEMLSGRAAPGRKAKSRKPQMWGLCLFALVVAVSGTTLTSQNAIYVLDEYAENTAEPQCDSAAFVSTSYEFAKKNAQLDIWCGQTPTSYLHYLFVFGNNSAALVQTHGANDDTCAGQPLSVQTVSTDKCFRLIGDNPVTSYKLKIVNGACADASACSSGSTCCYAPQGNQCVKGADQCCCPDYKQACPAGTGCLCGGACPGPQCQCVGCGPTSEGGFCINK